MNDKSYIGIDPGKSGGISIISPGRVPGTFNMPETVMDLWDTIHEMKLWAGTESKAVLELVHSSPQMGVKSAFTFGHGYGQLEMALTAAGIPWQHVRPPKWQKDMGCLTKGDKNVTKRMAQQLFPGVKVTHAIADSLLLAEWLRRQP